jgi:hypothetical protein
MPRHPEPYIRRAVRVMSMAGELHRRGYQRLRVIPYMAASGLHWRCTISLVSLFYRNHGAILNEFAFSRADDHDSEQATAIIAYCTSADENEYFTWKDARQYNARALADKFLSRFLKLAELGAGWDYPYAGWYLRLLWFAEAGWLPVVLSDYGDVSSERVPLLDVRPKGWRRDKEEAPILPLPHPGELQQDYKF